MEKATLIGTVPFGQGTQSDCSNTTEKDLGNKPPNLQFPSSDPTG